MYAFLLLRGNQSSAGHHASGVLSGAGATYDVEIRVPENAESFMIYTWVNESDRMSVSLKSPAGEIVPRAPAKSGEQTVSKLILEKSTVIVDYYFPLAETGVQYISTTILDPTPGIWTMTLYGDIVLNGRFDSWLPMTRFFNTWN